MKPYPRYKPTGLAWLPSVPEHWEVVKIKRLFREIDERNRDLAAPLLSFSRTKGILPFSDVSEKDPTAGDLSLYKILRPGLLLENRLQAWSGMFAASDVYGCVSPDYSVFRPRSDINVKFFEYVFRSPFQVEQFANASRGVGEGFNRLYTPQFGAIETVLPPPSEQDRIVRYLDEKTAAIDELVRAKEREIDLLRELIIWHAEDAMRTAPKARFRLKRFVRQIAEEITVEPAREYHPLGVLNRGRGLFHKEPVLGADLGDSTFFHVHPGDMIISGQFAWEGAVAMLEESERGCVASHRYPLVRSASDDLRLEYLWAFFQTHYGDMVLNLHSHGAAGRNRPLNFGELLDEYVPVPSLDRQEKIVDLVQKLSLVRRTAKAFKDRMVELRTRLVSDAVTGAVEV